MIQYDHYEYKLALTNTEGVPVEAGVAPVTPVSTEVLLTHAEAGAGLTDLILTAGRVTVTHCKED